MPLLENGTSVEAARYAAPATRSNQLEKGCFMKLSDKKDYVGEFDDCVHKDILSFVRYPDNGGRCFCYPQYLVDDETLRPLSTRAFPDNGCLPLAVAGTDLWDVKERYGNLVVMVVNDSQLQINFNYPERESSYYNGAINPNYGKGRSAVEFCRLSQHSLSAAFVQVLNVQEQLDLTAPLRNAVHLDYDQVTPQTNLVLIAQETVAGEMLYGPFEQSSTPGGEITLKAVDAYEKYIASMDSSSFGLDFEICDDEGLPVARFVDTASMRGAFDGAKQSFDLIEDSELIDAIGRISRIAELPFSKAQMRSLKTEIAKCLEERAKISMTPKRRERMLALVSAMEDWSSLPEEMKASAIETAEPEDLAEFVLSDEHFQAFYDKVITNEQVREKAEQERARYKAQADEAKRDALDAKEQLSAVKSELDDYTVRIESKRKELENEVAKATAAKQAEKEKLEAEVKTLTEEKDKLEEDKALIRRQTRQIVEKMSDELVVSDKILENEMIRQIVSSLNDAESELAASEKDVPDQGDAVAGHRSVSLRGDESSLTASEILDIFEDAICNKAGRDVSRNDVANYVICLMQGYITTFAGMPGTGKTSLVGILAGMLGLTGETQRFIEIPVEKGWTSYKDFIGYYNPFTKQTEKSNAEVFEAFEWLDSESQAGIDTEAVPPYLFLLDEANLSSIEHYWSPFLRACDRGGDKPVSLALGGDLSFEVPGYTRFVATVNFDHTTEELSPRFLDRSWVIMLDPEAFDYEEDGEADDYDFDDCLPFSYAKLIEVFGSNGESIERPELRAKLKEVLELCSHHGYKISPRSQRMMRRYISAADRVMDHEAADTRLAPVDYAISQKVLPQLSGADESVGTLLEELAKVTGLPITKARVERMLKVSGDSGYYQYFA